MKRCVIIGGADINNYGFVKGYLKADDFYIYCDSGLKHMKKLSAEPDLIVGDFDSYENPNLGIETIVLPREKDDTDTVFAVKEAVKRGFDEFLLIGVVGARLDHTLVNVSVLAMLDSLQKKCRIVDDYSEMELLGSEHIFIDESYSYFSLVNIFGKADGIYEKNAKYELNNGEITCEYQYGTSNEVLKGKKAEVWVESGRLLLIKVKNNIQ